MEEGGDIKEFPDVSSKLAAPKKLSAFEREKQAAEAKRQRAEAENAAALKAFEDSFANDDDYEPGSGIFGGRGPPVGPRGEGLGYAGQGGRNGLPPSGPRSGPGSLGPGPGPPPPSLKRKRVLEEMREAQEARREHSMLGSESSGNHVQHDRRAGQQEEHEDDTPKPTVHLSSLPPDITGDGIRDLLRGHLDVDAVHFLPPTGPGIAGKRSVSAIATLATDTSTTQIDSAVTALKDKYLRCGLYLSIFRHLSSTALHPSLSALGANASDAPFGAERPREDRRVSMRNAPPPSERRGFAPPDTYDTRPRYSNTMQAEADATVPIRAPLNVETLKAIHCIADVLLSESDPMRALHIERALQGLEDVQKDERFAFLFDSRSPAGLYYRYLLWSPEDADEVIREQKKRARGLERVYQDSIVDWAPPYDQVLFPDLTSLAQVVTDMDYLSSDEESDDDGAERRFNEGRDAEPASEANGKKQLSPIKRARLLHLLSRLPTTNARLRKGDVARVTNFVINHAGHGAEEIIDLLLLNVEKPFSYSLASKYEDSDSQQDEEDEYEPGDDLPAVDASTSRPQKDSKRDEDPSNAKLIALYLISDILSASSTAGARNAWKYRQLFESGFKVRKTFELLGKLDKELDWGRLKTEQWKRKVGVVFGIWEGWSVFSGEVHEELKRSFFEPPLSNEERAAEHAERQAAEQRKQDSKLMGIFKRVGRTGSASGSESPAPAPLKEATETQKMDEDIDGGPMEDLIGVPQGEYVDGKPLTDEVDGVPMADELEGAPMDDGVDGIPMGMDGAADEMPVTETSAGMASSGPETKTAASAGKPSGSRKRMRAEDMFADSDED